ncbi:MAG: hypothetical protein IPP69_16675 [Flavobacteriales bacterium]|nr:hypothetical protein [Flavobacteriales bacterium]
MNDDLKILAAHGWRDEPSDFDFINQSLLEFITSNTILSTRILMNRIIPPYEILKGFFEKGFTDSGMSGNSQWKLFEFTKPHYQTFINWAKSEVDMEFEIIESADLIPDADAWGKYSTRKMLEYIIDPKKSISIIKTTSSKLAFQYHLMDLTSALYQFVRSGRKDGRFRNIDANQADLIEEFLYNYLITEPIDDKWESILLGYLESAPPKRNKKLGDLIGELKTRNRWRTLYYVICNLRRLNIPPNEFYSFDPDNIIDENMILINNEIYKLLDILATSNE